MQVRRCCKSQGLGQFSDLAATALKLFSGGGSASSGGASPGAVSSPITVSPQISTQISPSISPVFQQQFQPTNSAATAGTSAAPMFAAPSSPSYAPDGSVIPGAYPSSPSLSPVPGMPVAPGMPMQAGLFGGSKLPLLIIGAGLIGFLFLRKM